MRVRRTSIVLMCVLAGLLTACTSQPETGAFPASSTPVTSAPANVSFKVDEITGGLAHGWDIGFLPNDQLLVTQRPGKLALVHGSTPGSPMTEVRADFSDVLVKGEGGLMGIVIHPNFAQSRKFVTCQTHLEGGDPLDVRLVTWTLAADGRSAQRVGDLLTGLPVNPSGRHSGCRPILASDGALLVGTGDSARPSIAQDRHSLGGKVLRIDINTGNPLPDNPFMSSSDPIEQRIFSYGHRNIQGVAERPGTGQVFLTEHGPTINDEVNLLRKGGNYGWDPAKGGTDTFYDESVPMTDTSRFPEAISPLWTSGDLTEAVCGAAFLSGPQWGNMDGKLAVVALKGQKMLLFTLDGSGAVAEVLLPKEFNDTYGRLRAARTGPDGSLFVTTSTGTNDKVLRVTPA